MLSLKERLKSILVRDGLVTEKDLARALEGIGPAGASRRAAKEILSLI